MGFLRLTGRVVSLLLVFVGAVVLAVGVALIYVPAGVIVLGLALAAAGLFLVDVGR